MFWVMGTRAYTLFKKGDETIAAIYRQSDGYLDGHGKFLREEFGRTKIINGMRGGEAVGTHANGMGCLAAQVVCAMKDDLGGTYLLGLPDEDDIRHTDYIYILTASDKDEGDIPVGRVMVEVLCFGEQIYKGELIWLPSDSEIQEDQ